MAYTRVWDSSKPVGALTQARDIDLEIRNLKGDLEERLEEVLITDITDDPWAVKDEVKGKNAVKDLFIGPWSFDYEFTGAASSMSKHDDYYATSGGIGGAIGRCDIALPIGVTLINYTCYHNRNGSTGNTLDIKTLVLSDASQTSLSTLSLSNSTYGALSSGSINHVITADRFYRFKLTIVTNFKFYGVSIRYSAPDSRYTR